MQVLQHAKIIFVGLDRTHPRSQHDLASVGRVRTRRHTFDRVNDELAGAIRDLRIPPGSALSETDLAEQPQATRPPGRAGLNTIVLTAAPAYWVPWRSDLRGMTRSSTREIDRLGRQ